jgi:hypothetical protein
MSTVTVPAPREGDVLDALEGVFRPAQGVPAPAVTVLRHMVFGSGLVEAHDMTGLLHMLFLVAEGRPFTVRVLLESMRAEGIRAANGSGLIGNAAVFGMVRRFIEAGFVRKLPQTKGGAGRFRPQEYEVYLDPAYNPDWEQAHASPGLAAPEDAPEPPRPAPSTARPASSTSAEAESAPVPAQASPGPASSGGPTAAAARDASEVSDAGAGREDAREADVAEARELLLDLPRPWSVGLKTAKDLAPLLARAARLQGWELDRELVAQLTAQSGAPVRSYRGALRYRIEELPRRRPRYGSGGGGPRGGRGPLSPCPKHPQVEADRCVPCNDFGPVPGPPAARASVPGPQEPPGAARPERVSQPTPAAAAALEIIERARRSSADRNP